MSDKDAKSESPKKGKGFIKMALIGLVLAGAGGGAVFGLMSAGIIGANPAHAKPTGPQLVMKGDDDPYAAPKKEEKGSVPLVHGEGGSKYRTTYYTFAEDFTSNLKDSDALVQMSLAAATRRDGRVLMWMDEHALAIRDAFGAGGFDEAAVARFIDEVVPFEYQADVRRMWDDDLGPEARVHLDSDDETRVLDYLRETCRASWKKRAG